MSEQLTNSSLTCESLTWLLRAWQVSFRNGRNNEDLRFGQHCINSYDLTDLPKELDNRIYNEESAQQAFNMLYSWLLQKETGWLNRGSAP